MPEPTRQFAPSAVPDADDLSGPGRCGECGADVPVLVTHASEHAHDTAAWRRALRLPDDHLIRRYLEDVDA